MPVGITVPQTLQQIAGVRLAVGAAGLRYKDRDDLCVLEFCDGASSAAVFTRNAFCAAPVVVAKQHLNQTSPRALLINSGNANAGTGEIGLADANACCGIVAELLGCRREQVLPFSTGVIGEPLPVEKFRSALPAIVNDLAGDRWLEAAHAIMTTDTVAKGVSKSIQIDGHPVNITGIAKGAGMIRPDMATMLCFIASDADVSDHDLQQALNKAVECSFNRITVDGDTSTNDACVLTATGRSGVRIEADSDAFGMFTQALTELCQQLAQALIRDGEGATKFITVQVNGGGNSKECLDVAYTIAHSPLVKTAFFAADPNWGRILAAIGRAGLQDLDVEQISIYLGDVRIVRDGGRDPEYSEQRGQQVMDQEEIVLRVELHRGAVSETVWTSDLSHDYVRINAEYRT